MDIEELKEQTKKELAVLTQDYDHKNARWNLPPDMIPVRQEQIRLLKFRLQAAVEKELLVSGTPQQIAFLRPLVLRRETLRADSKDGELFSFAEQKTIVLKVRFCPHIDSIPQSTIKEIEIANAHLAQCSEVYEKEQVEVLRQIKHSRGNCNCQGCLEAPPTESPLLKKWIVYCPKFIQALVDLGPVEYSNRLRQHNPDITVCYAGLLHSEVSREGRVLTWTRKCDTCGYETREQKELALDANPSESTFDVAAGKGTSDQNVMYCFCPDCKEQLFEVSEEEQRLDQLTPEHDELITKHSTEKHGE